MRPVGQSEARTGIGNRIRRKPGRTKSSSRRRPRSWFLGVRLQAALAHLPPSEYRAEAVPLAEELERVQQRRRRGPQVLGDILPIVLAGLGAGGVQSTASGEPEPR